MKEGENVLPVDSGHPHLVGYFAPRGGKGELLMNVSKIEHTECRVCGERLTDPRSVARGIGPVCERNLSKFVASVGSSAEEIASLALMGDSATSRMLRVAMKAVALGHKERAMRFFESAREAAKFALDVEAAEEKAA